MIAVNLNVLAWLQPPDWSRAQQEINSLHTVLTVLLFHQFHILRIYHVCLLFYHLATLYYVQSTQYCTKYIPFLSPAVSPYILHSHSFSIPQCFLLLNPSILLFPRMSPLSLFLFSVHTHWNSSLFLLIFPLTTFLKYFPNSFFSFHSFLFLHFLLLLT